LFSTYRNSLTVSADRFNQSIPQAWDKSMITEKVKFLSYGEYMHSDTTLLDALQQLKNYGLVFIKDVPESEKAVEEIGGRIGSLRDTFYGRTWDVKSVPEAKNVAYTDQNLGFHMDLLYMSDPPGIQLLHCLKNSCSGGSSLFSDSFLAAKTLRQKNNLGFGHCCHFRITYQYRNADQHYYYSRPVIELGRDKQIEFVNWSPPFQAPFDQDNDNIGFGGELRVHLHSLKEFASIIEAPENIYEYKLKERECVLFNNRRVLHARRAFDVNSGERWLKGAYLDTDVFNSRYRVLKERSHGKESK